MTDPNTRYERGLDVLSTLGGSVETGRALADFLDTRGALGSFAIRIGAGEIWSRAQLSRRDRSLVVISFLTALGRELELRQHVAGGLNHGLSRDEIDEIMVQVCAYAGMPVALAGSTVVASVFAQRDGAGERQAPPAPAEPKDDEKRRADGLEVLKTLLGNPELDMKFAESATIEQLGDMGKLVLDFAFGDVWSRPQLSRRDRSLVVVSVLTALSLMHELEIHLGGALNHGVTEAEIEEVMLTMVLYGGFPRAIDGMHMARKVFAARAEA
ncbi:MAG: carboxymuconolactone decarboxylase family protein [Myxococcota bacterium]|nr:carboxymuconolactone decarboxylase family protein [Myxococcota bacterium]